MLVAEEVHRIVLGHADQREAERERDAMHGTEHGAHGREAGQPGAGERQQAEHEQPGTAVRDEQQHCHAECREAPKPLRLALGAFLHQHRECARAARHQLERRIGADLFEGALQHVGGLALALWIEAGRAGLSHKQRLPAGRVEPHVVQQMWLARWLPRLGELQQLERWVARQPRLQEARGGRGEVTQPFLELRPQERRIESLIIEGR